MKNQTMEVEHKQACTELLELVIDGQATQEQYQELMGHLKRCEECREEYLLSKSIIDSLQSHVKPNHSPSGLAQAIQHKIAQTASPK